MLQSLLNLEKAYSLCFGRGVLMISVRGQRVGLNSYDPAVVEVLKQKRAQVSAAREVRCTANLSFVAREGARTPANAEAADRAQGFRQSQVKSWMKR